MLAEVLRIALFSLFSVFISAMDIKNGEIPRVAFAIAFPFFFTFNLLISNQNWLRESMFGLVLGLITFLLAFIISKGKLGLADVWYSALIGMVSGLWRWYVTIALSCFAGILFIVATKKRKIPFIPFMALGNITAEIFIFFCDFKSFV